MYLLIILPEDRNLGRNEREAEEKAVGPRGTPPGNPLGHPSGIMFTSKLLLTLLPRGRARGPGVPRRPDRGWVEASPRGPWGGGADAPFAVGLRGRSGGAPRGAPGAPGRARVVPGGCSPCGWR